MNLMFLNSLEKAAASGEVRTAQVSIGEEQGVWHVMWSEQEENGRLRQESWYEGLHWEEMLAIFRERVFSKQCEGFHPLLEMKVSELSELDERSAQQQFLFYYSEQHANESLYEELRQWRIRQAAQESKRLYLVASNRLLKLIAAFVPHTEEELLQLPGMGRMRMERYGKELLAMTMQVERTTRFPLDWVNVQVSEAEVNGWLLQEKEKRRQTELEKETNKRLLLETIESGGRLEELQEKTKVARKELLEWVEELDRDGYDVMPLIDRVLESVPAEHVQQAWQAFEEQGDRYLKPVLQTIHSLDGMSGKELERHYEWLRLLRLKYRGLVRSQTSASEAS
ncbi:HRDC domain-containing protein [Paenibacillus sp. YYML68]|uniref:HRDC domain-containing protein n=1 Tax=Paenibacillus sp. YYML68 TaxID=2909250 RepID=UPI00249091DE|nr:HRDC domain-containing protein [Paenibacillus sp. YYML68]